MSLSKSKAAGDNPNMSNAHPQIDKRVPGQSFLLGQRRTLEMIADGVDLREILDELCRTIDAQQPEVISSVLLADVEGKQLWPAAGPKLPDEWTKKITPLPINANVGSCGTAAFLKQTVIVSDIASDPLFDLYDYRAEALRHGLLAAWSQPLVSKKGRVLGTFVLYYKQSRTPTPDDLQLIEETGQIARIAIESAQSRSALQSALDEIKRSEARPQEIVDVIPQTITVLDPDGTIIFANQAVLDYTGLSVDDVKKPDFRDRVFHPEDVERLREERKQALLRGAPFENEQRARGRDGTYRWFLIRYKPLRDESGHTVRWYVSGTNIDDLKRAEAKLRHDEQELRQLVDSLPQHVLVLDAKGSILQVNQMMLDYLGRTLEQMQSPATSVRITRDLHPDDLERVQAERSVGISAGVPFEIEKRLPDKNGRYRWFLFRYKPLLGEKGQVAKWFVTATDIDDRKQTEERMRNETLALREEIVRASMFEEIVGSSNALHRVLAQVIKVAPTDSTVLIFGETGTGKELIARSIHRRSKRADRAFIAVNCAAIPQSLIASELFGHEKGAFTGAAQRRLGRFESADGGTIFLDEVGELPLETQIALLRVLQDKKIERVGSSQSISVDIRVLAATNRDLNAAIAAGTFRRDLFYRLNVVPIEMPSLRQRKDDIPLLVEYLIDRYAQKTGKKLRNMERKTLELLEAYDWPGNIRELQNVVERAVILADGETFSVDETWFVKGTKESVGSTVPFADEVTQHEKELIEAALKESKGRVSGPSGAAARLGIPRQTLDSRIKVLGIDKYRFKVR